MAPATQAVKFTRLTDSATLFAKTATTQKEPVKTSGKINNKNIGVTIPIASGIISAFPGIGKTTLAKEHYSVIDLESSNYKWLDIDSDLPIEQRKGMSKTLNPNFPENYIRDIVSLAREGYIVLISSHKEVRDELNKRNIPFTIVLPSLDTKQEMIDRYIKRGNQENFVTMLENNYETFVNDMMSDPNNKIVLDSGQYLKDVVRFI